MQWQRGNLVRGEGWCVALTAPELADLRDQAHYLLGLLKEAPGWLMEEETLTVEAVTPTLEVYLEGHPEQFTLTLRLLYDRTFEGSWGPNIAQAVLHELAQVG